MGFTAEAEIKYMMKDTTEAVGGYLIGEVMKHGWRFVEFE